MNTIDDAPYINVKRQWKKTRYKWTVHISNQGQESTRGEGTHSACTSIARSSGTMIHEIKDDSTELYHNNKNNHLVFQISGTKYILLKITFKSTIAYCDLAF